MAGLFEQALDSLKYYEVKTYERKSQDDLHVVIYEDHRFILPVLWCARKEGLIDNLPTLMTWDYHFDGLTDHKSIDRAQQALSATQPIEAVLDYTVQLLGNDDTWLTIAMEGALVGDAVYCFLPSTAGEEIRTMNGGHDDKSGNHHSFFNLDDFDYALSYEGELSSAKWERNRQLHAALSWDYKTMSFTASKPNIVLDIDLDAFSTPIWGRRYPWPEEAFRDMFTEPWENSIMVYGAEAKSLQDFLRYFVSSIRLITIAREPSCCGGGSASDVIMQNVERYVLDLIS